MNKGKQALNDLYETSPIYFHEMRYDKYFEKILYELDILEKIKKFFWVENDKLYVGTYGDCEIELGESHFENKDDYRWIKDYLTEK